MNRNYPARPWVSAHVIIFDKDKEKILLTKRAAPPKRHYWFPPGGAIDVGETVEEGVIRETLEETTIRITKPRFVDYIDAISRDEKGEVRFHFVVFMFVADYLEGKVEAKDDALDAKWFSAETIIAGEVPIPDQLIEILKQVKK
jgi:ADP-ribose pyrophosphatase YjhB (NUDIX family)